MKANFRILSHFILMAILAMACTKEVGLFTKVDFELTENHTGEGYINEALPTTITVLPEAEVEGFTYSFSYNVTSGRGHFEYADGTLLGAGEKIPLTPFSASFRYVGFERGEHTVNVKAEDSFGASKELSITYTITDVPVTWTASSTIEKIELGQSAEITLELDSSNSPGNTTYVSAYNISDDNGAFISLPDSTAIALGEFIALEPGMRKILFTPSKLGNVELDFPLKDSNGQELIAFLPFEVIGDVPVISVDLGEHDQIEVRIDSTLACPATLSPANATDQEINWISSDSSIVAVR